MTTTTSKSSSGLRHWWDFYQGDEECRFFKALSRSKYEWRTIEKLSKAANLSVKRTEQIAERYILTGEVQQHTKEPGKFRYWERASKKKKSKGSISSENKKKRVGEAGKKP